MLSLVRAGSLARYHRVLSAWFGLFVVGLLLTPPAAWGQPGSPLLLTPAQYMQGLHQHWTAPRAAEFASGSTQLASAVQAWCDAPEIAAPAALAEARARWLGTMVHWERLSAVTIGPLAERRSLRQIDFRPTRPGLIERAIQTAPIDAAAMERVGTPAKGLPALEWLLWKKPGSPASPMCRFAVQVALDIEREARMLESAFAQAAQRSWDDESAATAMSEVVNQWVTGLERLRWINMDRPLRAAGREVPAFPRSESSSTAVSWAVQWQALRALAVSADGEAPTPWTTLVSIESYLRAHALNQSADALIRATRRASVAMKKLESAPPVAPAAANVSAAAREIAALKQWAETELAPALGIRIGFSDADGD